MISPVAPKHDGKIIIYDIPTHPSAVAARQFFLKNGMRFDERDVTTSAAWAEHVMRQTGQNSEPLIEAAGKKMVGFTVDIQKQLEAGLKALR